MSECRTRDILNQEPSVSPGLNDLCSCDLCFAHTVICILCVFDLRTFTHCVTLPSAPPAVKPLFALLGCKPTEQRVFYVRDAPQVSQHSLIYPHSKNKFTLSLKNKIELDLKRYWSRRVLTFGFFVFEIFESTSSQPTTL